MVLRMFCGIRSHGLKLIFHCNANPFALGPRVGLDPKRENFVLGIPTCWYLKGQRKPCAPNAKPWGPNVKPCAPNVSQWNILRVGSPGVEARVGHVDFMLFVSISFALAKANAISCGIWALGLSYRYG